MPQSLLPTIACALVIFISAHARAQTDPVEIIASSYAPYMHDGDPLGLSLKMKSLTNDPYTFWRGSKDLFFRWCKTHASDWLDDRKAYLPTHGDLHLGNIGTYLIGDRLGQLGFGMVDFDDSAKLPVQLELLSGAITFRLLAQHNRIELSHVQTIEIIDAMMHSYRSSLDDPRAMDRLMNDEPRVANMVSRADRQPYSDILDQMTHNGRFRGVIKGKNGRVKEILTPAMPQADGLARAIMHAIDNSPPMGSGFSFDDVREVRDAIRDVARRTRIGSSGSQGLEKYLVLLNRPMVGIDHDVIIYLKQQIPSAAERTGVISMNALQPGHRCADHISKLTNPNPLRSSWGQIGENSFWVTVKDPWTGELEPEDVSDFHQLIKSTGIWGTIAGSAHARVSQRDNIRSRISPKLNQELETRSAQYLEQLNTDFQTFCSDPRVIAHIRNTDKAIDSARVSAISITK